MMKAEFYDEGGKTFFRMFKPPVVDTVAVPFEFIDFASDFHKKSYPREYRAYLEKKVLGEAMIEASKSQAPDIKEL